MPSTPTPTAEPTLRLCGMSRSSTPLMAPAPARLRCRTTDHRHDYDTLSTNDIVPKVGITGTPVIDSTTNTMYVISKSTISSTTFFQRLHALDITTGQEKFGGPVQVDGPVSGNGNGSSGGKLNFDLKWENNRPGLLLLNGIVYIGFGSHGDNGPWHGWILAYNAATLHQTSVFCFTPNGEGSGVWHGGAGLAADVPIP